MKTIAIEINCSNYKMKFKLINIKTKREIICSKIGRF